MSITRRHLVASGAGLAAAGSATVLAACGGDAREERTAERDVELLQRPLDAQATLAELYETAGDQELGAPVAAALEAFGAQAREHVELLRSRVSEAGGAAEPAPGIPPDAESAVEAIALALDGSIAAGHDIVGALSTAEARGAVYRVMIADAGQLAAIRGVLGTQQVPAAFVTGGPEPPLAGDPEAGGGPEGGS